MVPPRSPCSDSDAAPQRGKPLALRVLLGTLAVAVCLFGLGFVGFALAVKTEEAPLGRHADGMVVLTGGADRVSDAIELLANGQADRLLITGVNPMTSPESLSRRLPKLRTLVECCVTLGYQALDTAGNAWETARWVEAHKVHSLIVVTSNYHMPRALAEIGHAVRGVDLIAYPVVSDHARSATLWSMVHRTRLIASEYVKYVIVVTRQALFPQGPGTDPTIVAARSI